MIGLVAEGVRSRLTLIAHYRPFYEIKYPKGDWNLPSRVLPLSESRFRYDSLVPFQVYSCFNGLTVLDAALFHPPHNLRFRTSHDGTDTHSECYLLCSDIWQTFSPTLPGGTENPAHRRKKAGHWIDGARIQVVPRAAVGYSVLEYNRARGETNTTAFELEGEEKRAYEELERVDWNLFPPKLVTTYAYGELYLAFTTSCAEPLTPFALSQVGGTSR